MACIILYQKLGSGWYMYTSSMKYGWTATCQICRLVFVSYEDGTSRSTLCFPNYPGWPTPGCQIPMYKWFTSKVAHASCYLSGEAQEHSWHFRRKIANRPAGTDVIRQEKLLSCYRKDFLIGCLPHVTSMKSTIKSIAICSISCSRSNITIFMESVLLFPISTYRQKHRSYIDWPLYIGIENQQLEHCV